MHRFRTFFSALFIAFLPGNLDGQSLTPPPQNSVLRFNGNQVTRAPLVSQLNVGIDTITVDANHPLAGKTLNFDVTIVGVRETTREELDHGHVHGPGGHH